MRLSYVASILVCEKCVTKAMYVVSQLNLINCTFFYIANLLCSSILKQLLLRDFPLEIRREEI